MKSGYGQFCPVAVACVEADMAAMAKVWLGDVPYASALRSGEVRLTGPRPLAKAFPSWLMLSHFAGVPRTKLS